MGHSVVTVRLPRGAFGAWLVHVAACVALLGVPASAQQLLDRVVARVDGYAVTLTDVRAAVVLGVVNVPEGGGDVTAIQRLIDRQLMLLEVARFAPPEPDPAAVQREVAAMRAQAGDRLDEVMRQTGVDEARIREMARDTLRIEEYLNQRFGVTVQVSDEEVAAYFRTHPEEFLQGGAPMPFAEAEPVARERAAAMRRAATVAQWLRDLRERADLALPGAVP